MPQLTWNRPTRREDDLALWNVWQSREGDYHVVSIRSKYGLPRRFVAMVRTNAILSSHRTRQAAMDACDRHARQEAMVSVPAGDQPA